jgi:RNA polymerase sigma-70 factor, ECF subfamily
VIEGEWVSEDVSPGRPSFDEFVEREFAPTLALGLALLHDEDDALDVAQETMARALERWDEVGGLDRPGAWSRRVALNLVTDKLRGRTRRRRLTGRLARRPLDQAVPTEVEAWDAAFWSEVASLPERQRNATVLFYVHDLTVAEIAEIVDAAEGTVKSDLSRARDRLRKRLAQEES